MTWTTNQHGDVQLSGAGWVYDPRAQEAALSTLTSGVIRGGFEKDDDGELYLIQGSGLKKYQGGTTNKTMRFKSKTFVTPSPVSFGWISVDAKAYPVSVKVFADGNVIANYAIGLTNNVYSVGYTSGGSVQSLHLQEPVIRLPATVAKEWHIEVYGDNAVNEVCIAQSIDEVKVT